MIPGHQIGNAAIIADQGSRGRAIGTAPCDRAGFCMMRGNIPPRVVARCLAQGQINHPQMRAEKAGHDGGFSDQINAVRGGKYQMGMPGDNHINPVNGGQCKADIFGIRVCIAAANARVRQRNNQINPGLLQIGNQSAGGVQNIINLGIPFQMTLLPYRGLGWQKPDHGNVQPLRLARFINQVAGHQQVLLTNRRGSLCVQPQIRGDNRKRRIAQTADQRVQAMTEFMIAQGGGVIMQMVHRRDHRMHAGIVRRIIPGVGHIIAQSIAVQKVAVVKQHRIGRLPPRLFNQRCRARQPTTGRYFVGMIVPGQYICMQI